MKEWLIALIGVSPFICALLWKGLSIIASLPRRVARLEAMNTKVLESIAVQTTGLVAIAEAVAGKQCNGNVDDALTAMRADNVKMYAFLSTPPTASAEKVG